MTKVCIVCEKGMEGYPVEDDVVIHTIRGIKRRLNVAKNNELVVCENCLPEHKKKREKFEKNLVMHVVIAAVVLIIFFFVSVFSPSGISLSGIFLGAVLAALVVGMSVFNHWPKIAEGKIPANFARSAMSEQQRSELHSKAKEAPHELRAKPKAAEAKKKRNQ